MFGILLLGAFIPYQVFLYPLVRIFSTAGIYNSLPCIVIVHVIFGLPTMTLLFRNYYAGMPIELFKAARIDGGGFWTIFFRVMLPMSTPMLVVATILQVTGIWNDFIFGLTFAGRREPADDGAAQQHRPLDARASAPTTSTWRRPCWRRWSRSSSTSSPGAGSSAASPPAP